MSDDAPWLLVPEPVRGHTAPMLDFGDSGAMVGARHDRQRRTGARLTGQAGELPRERGDGLADNGSTRPGSRSSRTAAWVSGTSQTQTRLSLASECQ